MCKTDLQPKDQPKTKITGEAEYSRSRAPPTLESEQSPIFQVGEMLSLGSSSYFPSASKPKILAGLYMDTQNGFHHVDSLASECSRVLGWGQSNICSLRIVTLKE